MDETTIWKELAKYLWGLMLPLAVWIFNKQDKRLESLETQMYPKSQALERQATVNETLEARRKDVIELHAKIDSRAGKLDDKIDLLARDMHAGLSEIKTILLERK